MPPETRILFSFCCGSLGQRFLLAVGCSLPTAHDHCRQRGDRGYHYPKGFALQLSPNDLACHRHPPYHHHQLLPFLIGKPGDSPVEATDGTADYNPSRYQLSVFYELAKVAVNRLAFSRDMNWNRTTRPRSHAWMATLSAHSAKLTQNFL
jgi:hypothetical protein